MTAPNTMQRDAGARQTASGLVLPLPSPLLAMLPPELQGLPYSWWTQPIIILAVAPNATKQGAFTTDGSHVLVAFWGSLKVRSNDNQTDRDADAAVYTMTDTRTNNYAPPAFPVDVANTWGNAKQPAIWPVPLIVPASNGINLNVTNQSAANTNNYNFAFVGVLITVS